MLMSNSRNIVFHRKSDFHPTRKRVGFTSQFITYKSFNIKKGLGSARLLSPEKKENKIALI